MTFIQKDIILKLQQKKNLLAFSAGVDSTALFFLLQEHNISFDIALVNYGLREASKEEEAYAHFLAKEYNLKVYTIKAPKWHQNFEKHARDFRYKFFDKIMEEYDHLLTAHQLNDQLEWFLMRLTKGAGIQELLGLETISKRKNYLLIRPLLKISKESLLNYLEKHKHHYFVDSSNFTTQYERNVFREDFANQLIEQYEEGIKRSFNYLEKDKHLLLEGIDEIFHTKKLYVIEYREFHQIVRVVDQYLKKLGYLLSAQQRTELDKEKSIVFGEKWAVEIVGKTIFIAPYKQTPMPKEFKEKCRILKIPSKIRSYLYEEQIDPKVLKG